jgi:hypothetical protein
MFDTCHLICLWILHPIRKFLMMMQIRRDLSILFFLLILFFLIVLFYQLHYTYDPSSRIQLPIFTKNEKFRIAINEYPSVWILISNKKKIIFLLFVRFGIKKIVLKSNFPKKFSWKNILIISKPHVRQPINSVG